MIVGNAAGALTVGVPKVSRGYIPKFFEAIEGDSSFVKEVSSMQ